MSVLHYGQVVRIHCVLGKEGRQGETTGLITSKSYIDPTLYFQTYTSFKNIPNYRESLFEILPMSSFDINDELNNAPPAKRQSLEPRAKTEREQFEALIAQKRGQTIYFGAQVVFKHYDSGYYITGCFECARSGIGAFKIYLSPTLSSQIIFKLQSRRTYEKDGDQITLRAPIMIYHERTHCYLSFQPQGIFLDANFKAEAESTQEIMAVDDSEADRMLAIRPVVKSPPGKRYELINENIPKRAWRIEEHECYQPLKPKELICNHDLVYFLHTKDNKYMLPNINHPGVYLKKIKDEEVLGDFFDGVWEIEEECLESDIQPGRMMSIARRSKNSQQPLGIEKRLIVRHLTSGRVLVIDRYSNEPAVSSLSEHNLRQQVILGYESKKLEDNALVNFTQDGRFLDAVVRQQHAALDAGAMEQMARSEILEYRVDEKVQALKNAYEAYYEKCGLSFNQVMNEHGFRIYKFSEEYKQQLLVVLSSQELINQFTNFLTVRNELFLQRTLNFTLLNDVSNTMRNLIGFIYNCDYDQIKVLGSNPVPQRQKVLGDLGMAELVTALVCQINRRSDTLAAMLEKTRKSEYTRIRNIYELGYEILESMAKNNRILKLQISIYLREYLNQILKPENKVVYGSIQVLLEDNYLAIEKLVTREFIDLLIKSFNKAEPDPEDLKFLSTLCICQGQGRSIKENQNAVDKLFYRVGTGDANLSSEHSDKFKFREDHDVMQIGSMIPGTGGPRYRRLRELYKDCEEELEDAGDSMKDKGHWRYFIEYLNLLADLCMHRNSEAQNYVEHYILPLNRLVAFLQEAIVREKGLYQPFIRLAHYAYIENYMYDEISRISKAKYWNDNSETFDIPRAKNKVGDSLEEIMNMIMSYIRKINNRKLVEEEPIILDPNNIEQLRNVYTFLELLKSTLNLGFWASMSKLKEMVPCMLRIMKFDEDFAQKRYEEATANKSDEDKVVDEAVFRKRTYERSKVALTLNKPDINLLVRCKILAAEILDIILDNQNNIRVSIITKLFKDILQMNLDLSEFDITEESQAELDRQLREYPEYHKFKPDNEKERNMLNEKIWIRKLEEMLSRRDIFSEVDPEELNPMLILLEISCYRNETLTNYSLSLLGRIYGQRSEVLQNFSNIIIVSKGNLLDLSRRAEETRSRLLPLASYNILTVTLSHPQQRMWDNRGKEITCVIQELAYLTLKMKKNNNDNPMSLYEYESLYPYGPAHDERNYQERAFSIISEKEEPNTLHQNLIKSQDHHLILFEFIKIMEELPEADLPSKVLHATYNFLTVLVWNNKENKDSLEYFLKRAVVHLQYNIGCIDFYREMFSNNKKLVMAESDLSTLVDLVVSTANRLEITSYYKSKLMDFLRVLVIFDDKGEQKNQNIVMEVISRYQVSSSNKTVFISNAKYWSINPIEFKDWITAYTVAYRHSCEQLVELKVSPELSYVAHFFEIFSALIENENTINIGKCTNMHPYEWLVELIEGAKNCWPVVRHLRSYINKLYYAESRQIETQQYELFVNKELKIISEELLDIARLRENCPQYGNIRLQNPIRYTYMGSYVFMALEEILVSLKCMFASSEFTSYFNVIIGQSKETKATFHYDMIHIVETLSYLMVRLDGREINKFMEEVRDLMRSILITSFPLEILLQYDKENKAFLRKKNEEFGSGEDVPFKKRYVFYEDKSFWRQLIDWYSFDKQEKQRAKMANEIELKEDRDRRAANQETDLQKEKEYRVNIFCMGKIEKKIREAKHKVEPEAVAAPAEKPQSLDEVLKTENVIVPKNLLTSKSKHFKLKNEPELTPERENIVVNTRRRKLLKFISVNREFERFKKQEFYEFCEQLANADLFSERRYGMVVIGAEDIIRAFVEMNEANPNFLRFELKLTLLNLLTNYITRNNEATYKTKPVDKWESHDWLENRQTITRAQEFLNDCNCAKLICSLIKYNLESSLEMVNRLLLFGVAFLLGGNRACQDSFMAYFVKDDKNIIFSQLEKLIKRSNERIAISAGSKAQVNAMRTTHSDTYDFYDERENIMERRFGYEEETSEEEKLFKQLVSALSRVYRFLQLLCEGNNSEMKNYIRGQVDADGKIKTANFDFIEITNVELRRLFKILDNELVELPLSLIDFLNEVTQLPCIQNQITLCKGTFFEDVCLVQKTKTTGERSAFESTLLSIFNKSIDIALSCLEGNEERIFDDLSRKVESFFLVRLIEENIKEITTYKAGFRAFEKELKQSKTHDLQIRQILKIVCVVSKLDAWGGNKKFSVSFEKNLSEEMHPMVALLRSNLLCIEILYQDKPQLVYFPHHPVYGYLSDITKDKIMFEINRETQRDKLIGLIKTSQEITSEINYNYDLDHWKPNWSLFTIPVTPKLIGQFRAAAQYTSVIICFMMVMWATVFYYPDDEAAEYYLGARQGVLNIMSIVQFIFTFMFFAMWLKNRAYLSICKYDEDLKKTAKEEQGTDSESKGAAKSSSWGQRVQNFLLSFRIIKTAYCLYLYENEFLSVLLFFIASILGTFYKIEFTSIHLFDLVAQIDLLTNVFQAITLNVKLLSIISLLGVSFIGIFSVFSFSSYLPSIYPEDVPDEHCESVLGCIMTLYLSQEINNDQLVFNPFRFAFDLIYVIFTEQLISNIITGIMIDTFASQRDRRNSIEDDKKGFCFICGISRETLQKDSVALEQHYRESHHFLWNYVFYEYYLHDKELKNITFTGLEYIIREMIDKDDAAWIPKQGDEGAGISDQLDILQKEVGRCTEIINSIAAPARD